MFYAVLRDMVLYLHKNEKEKKTSVYNNVNNAIRIHHALATKATNYTKKAHVFRLQTADWAEYLFETRLDSDAHLYEFFRETDKVDMAIRLIIKKVYVTSRTMSKGIFSRKLNFEWTFLF